MENVVKEKNSPSSSVQNASCLVSNPVPVKKGEKDNYVAIQKGKSVVVDNFEDNSETHKKSFSKGMNVRIQNSEGKNNKKKNNDKNVRGVVKEYSKKNQDLYHG